MSTYRFGLTRIFRTIALVSMIPASAGIARGADPLSPCTTSQGRNGPGPCFTVTTVRQAPVLATMSLDLNVLIEQAAANNQEIWENLRSESFNNKILAHDCIRRSLPAPPAEVRAALLNLRVPPDEAVALANCFGQAMRGGFSTLKGLAKDACLIAAGPLAAPVLAQKIIDDAKSAWQLLITAAAAYRQGLQTAASRGSPNYTITDFVLGDVCQLPRSFNAGDWAQWSRGSRAKLVCQAIGAAAAAIAGSKAPGAIMSVLVDAAKSGAAASRLAVSVSTLAE